MMKKSTAALALFISFNSHAFVYHCQTINTTPATIGVFKNSVDEDKREFLEMSDARYYNFNTKSQYGSEFINENNGSTITVLWMNTSKTQITFIPKDTPNKPIIYNCNSPK
ncbi:hypothetical protein [Enterobacter sp. KBR-315C3_2022]|uniref:hypothetical protein n=1 Tax=Enterobacter sp. KBR-315C3_2022 TaxID=3242494 RepID=UPI0035290C96